MIKKTSNKVSLIDIYNMDGYQVCRKRFTSTEEGRVYMGKTLPKGVYLMRIESNKLEKSERLVIQ